MFKEFLWFTIKYHIKLPSFRLSTQVDKLDIQSFKFTK